MTPGTRVFGTRYPREIPENVQKLVGGYIETLDGQFKHIKWVESHNLHFTIKFLGEVDASQLEKLRNCIDATATEVGPFRLHMNGVGFFPTEAKPRVIWIGSDGGASNLLELFQRLENHLEEAGFDREVRPFSPHLTIGRAKKEYTVKVPPRVSDFEGTEFMVGNIALIKSTLTPNGPIYEKQYEAALTGKENSEEGDEIL